MAKAQGGGGGGVQEQQWSKAAALGECICKTRLCSLKMLISSSFAIVCINIHAIVTTQNVLLSSLGAAAWSH
jgi:hypothetical protein